jgi:hypothetical protein
MDRVGHHHGRDDLPDVLHASMAKMVRPKGGKHQSP